MADHLRRGRLGDGDHVVERHHGRRVGAHVELANVARLAAELLVGLHVNAVGAVVEVEVVHVGRAHVDLQASVICWSGTCRLRAFSRSMFTTNCGSFAVKELNRPRRSWRSLPSRPASGSRCRAPAGVATLVLHLERESAEAADAGDRRRQEGEGLTSRQLHQGPAQPSSRSRLAECRFAFALVDVLPG